MNAEKARSTGMPRKREHGLTCRWNGGCDAHWGVVENLAFADIPLCIAHIHETWRLAQEVADATNNRAATVEVEVAGKRVRQPRPTSRIGWIYYIRVGEHIKVGYASDLRDRLTNGYPPNAEFLAAHRGTMVDEKVAHSLLYLHRALRAEWYHPHPDVFAYIEQAKAQHGTVADPRRSTRPRGQQMRVRTSGRVV
jgi:hypothetical protein